LWVSEGGPNLHNGSLGKFCDQDPLVETYTSMDIETMLGLQQKHMVALALLIGCDYDLKGVEGIGCSHAMRFVRSFPEAEILDRSGFLHVPNLWLARTRSLLMQHY
jgi:5'-3' exonuclease